MRTVALLVALAGSLVLLSQRSRVQAWAFGLSSPSRLSGRAAPELPASVRTLDGKRLTLASLRGRTVLLHFWTFG
jgi:hypothetical protein